MKTVFLLAFIISLCSFSAPVKPIDPVLTKLTLELIAPQNLVIQALFDNYWGVSGEDIYIVINIVYKQFGATHNVDFTFHAVAQTPFTVAPYYYFCEDYTFPPGQILNYHFVSAAPY